jgi:hypothetical protein
MEAAQLRFGSSRVAMAVKTGPFCRLGETNQLLHFEPGLGFYYQCPSGDCASLCEFSLQDGYVISSFGEELNWWLAWWMRLLSELKGNAVSPGRRLAFQVLLQRISNGEPYAEQHYSIRPGEPITKSGFPDILPGRDIPMMVLKSCDAIVQANLGKQNSFN